MTDSISTRNVWPNYNEANVKSAASRDTSDTLGKDQFLKILVTQLRNQDPMQPMQDRDFIAQMAQFTSVEQLMNMASELSLMRQSIGSASSLIGKTIEWSEYNDKGEIVNLKGVVESIISRDGLLFAKVGGSEIGLDYVHSISDGNVDMEQPGDESDSDGGDADGGIGEEVDAS